MNDLEPQDINDWLSEGRESLNKTKETINTPIEVKIKKIDKRAVLPKYAHDGDVGMDLTAISVEYDKDYDMYIYHTGLSMETDKHYGTLLFPRSSNRKTDAYLCNHVGVVDSAIYRGEIILCFKNRDSLRSLALEARYIEYTNSLMGIPTIDNGFSTTPLSQEKAFNNSIDAWNAVLNHPMTFAPYKVGDRIAQMVVIGYPQVNIVETKDELSKTERGSGGFGSTGN